MLNNVIKKMIIHKYYFIWDIHLSKKQIPWCWNKIIKKIPISKRQTFEDTKRNILDIFNIHK